MNFGQLKWKTAKLAGRTPTDAETSAPADIAEAVNDAYRELCDLEPWDFLRVSETLPLVAGDNSYTLPVYPLRTIDSATLADGGNLSPRAPLVHDDRTDDASGKPSEYALRGHDTIEVWPTPDKAYSLILHGWRRVPELANDNDIPIIEDEYTSAIAYLAAVGLIEQTPVAEGDQRIAQYSARVASTVDRMREWYQRQHDTTPVIIGGRSSRRPYIPRMGR